MKCGATVKLQDLEGREIEIPDNCLEFLPFQTSSLYIFYPSAKKLEERQIKKRKQKEQKDQKERNKKLKEE